MKSTVEELAPLVRRVNVEVPVDKINQSFGKVYSDLQKKVSIKGFRKGKAPINVVRQMYKDKVSEDVVRDLLNEGYIHALTEHKLDPINQPKFDFDQLNEDKSFNFTMTFEVRPQVEVSKYEGLVVEKEKYAFDDSKIDEVMQNILNSRAETVDVFEDRPLAEGDIAKIDFEGFVDGQPLEGGKADGHELEIGSNSFIEGFEEGLVGMKAGDERTVDLKFPDEYHAKEIAGKPVQFKVRLVSIKKKQTPEMTDEFVAGLGGPHKTVEELKQAVREDLEQNEKKRIQDEFRNRMMRELIKANPVEVPPSMLTQQKQALINDFAQRMQQQGMGPEDFEEYKQKWDADFEKSASEMIQSSFLISELAEKFELQCKDEDLEEKFKEFSEQAGVEVERVKEYYKEKDQISRLSFQVMEQKVMDFLESKADVKEVESSKLSAEQ